MFSYLFLICLFNSNTVRAYSPSNPYVNSAWVPGEDRYHGVHDGIEHTKQFINEWTVVIDGDEEVAQLVALELGYVYGGPVSRFHYTRIYLLISRR